MFTAHRGGMTVEEREVWGAAPARPPAWSTRTTLTAVGIAAALAVGGGLVVHAAGGGSTDGGPGRMGPPAGWEPGGPGGPGFPGGNTRTLHSEAVVSDGKGGYLTELTQTGDVSSATDTAITVRSQDGFTHSYVLDADTRRPHQPVQSGEQVTVRATVTNGTANATAVLPAR